MVDAGRPLGLLNVQIEDLISRLRLEGVGEVDLLDLRARIEAALQRARQPSPAESLAVTRPLGQRRSASSQRLRAIFTEPPESDDECDD